MTTNINAARWAAPILTAICATSSLGQTVTFVPGPSLDDTRNCPVEPTDGGIAGGGLAGDWDGPGQNAATIYWHVEGSTSDLGAGQRQALIDAMQAWANVVQITFVELPITNGFGSVDWNFVLGQHCAVEVDECGDPDCAFDGAGGTLAHAGFPPGINSACVNPMPETFAGNVHFDEGDLWEQDSEGVAGAFSLTLVACHELGHAIGLVHDASGGGDVMRPGVSNTDTFVGLTADDIANVRTGYAAGTGAVLTLNELGVWVNGGYFGTEVGTFTQPFNTVSEGLSGVPPHSAGIILHLQSGNYAENIATNKNVILQADNGPVTIGTN